MRYLKRAGGIFLNILFGAMLAVGTALIVMRICGFKILAVETGSMGRVCPVGSLIITEICSPEDIQAGDVISFIANEELVMVTHRVVEVDSENRCFYTKGDANNIVDGNPAAFENLIGRMKYRIPKLGYITIWAHTKGGKTVIVLGFMLIAVCVTADLSCKKLCGKERKNDKSAK